MDERRENDPFTINEGNEDNHDDAASQGSQRRSTSLLERIQRQRELEAATAAAITNGPATSNAIVNSTTMPPSVPQQNIQAQIQVPQYGPMPGFGNTSDTTTMPPAPNHQSGYSNNTWNSFTQRMESSMMGDRPQINSSPSYDNNDEMHHALLPPASRNDYSGQTSDEYSISQYFLTFVKDIYELFIWLPIAVRIVVVAGLLYVVVKFI